MRHECYFCQLKAVEKLIQKFKPDDQTAEFLLKEVHNGISSNFEKSTPHIAREIHKTASRWLKNNELYREEKDRANSLLLDNYGYWKKYVLNSDSPFKTAAKLAVIGNVLDYGAHTAKEDVLKQINEILDHPLTIDKTSLLEEKLIQAENIIYLGDNAGEIVFDRLFIEIISRKDLIYVTRGNPVINDITLEDARKINMQEVCRLMSNGYDAPSTILECSSTEFREAFDRADLIISKGQGNFEGLMENQKPGLFFLLIAKCKPMADLLGVKKGDLVVTNR